MSRGKFLGEVADLGIPKPDEARSRYGLPKSPLNNGRGSFGGFQAIDVGKRVYSFSWGLQMENQPQLQARRDREARA